jgi:hypothetical protein
MQGVIEQKGFSAVTDASHSVWTAGHSVVAVSSVTGVSREGIFLFVFINISSIITGEPVLFL